MKKTLKAISLVVLIFVVLFLIIAGIIQIPAVQNKIVHYATTFVSDKTHTSVEIKHVSISFPKSVVIEGLFLEDLKKDTLIYAGSVKVNIALTDLLFSKINVKSIDLENLNLNLYSTKTDSLFNYNFLMTAFADTTKADTTQTKTPSAWTFTIDKVKLKNIRLRYDDEFAGMNVSASLEELKLSVNKLDLPNSVYNLDDLLVEKLVANIQMTESSDKSTKKSTSVLPKILANNIQINNSTVNFGDSINKQSVLARIKRFELKTGAVDLQNESVNLDKIYLSESIIQYKTSATDSIPVSNPVVPVTPENDWNVKVRQINLENNVVAYLVGTKSKATTAFDSDRLKFRHLNLIAKDLYYSSDKTEVTVKKFNAIDQNNFAITRFQTDFSMDNHSITAKDIIANTTNSSLAGDMNIRFTSLKSLKDSLPYLVLNIDIRNAGFTNSDILYFGPQLSEQAFFKNKTNITTMSGQITGSINNLNGKNLIVKTGIKTLLETDFNIKGLPEAQTASYDFPKLKFISGSQDIKMMAGPAIPDSINLPEDIAMLIVFKGKLKSFKAAMGMSSSFGNANVSARIDSAENFNSVLNIKDFDLGSLLNDKEMFGPVTLTARIDGKGLDKKTMKADVKAEVSKIFLNKYTYHQLKMDGTLANQQFDGKINLNDENAVLDFDGMVNFIPGKERYKFRLNVQGVDLQKLNFTKDDLRISFNAQADLKGGTVDKLNGKAGIGKMIIVHNRKKYILDSVLVASINRPRKSEMNLNSALIGIKYSGTLSPTSLPGVISLFTNRFFPFSDTKPDNMTSDSTGFNFEIQLHNHPLLSEVLLPELSEFDPGIITGSFDSRKSELKLTANMHKIVYGSTEINNLVLDVQSDSTALKYKLSSSSISNSQINLTNFLFDGKMAGNKISANLSSVDGLNKKLLIRSEITKDIGNYKLVLDPNDFYLMNNRWDIATDNAIEFGKQGFLIHHLYFRHAESQLNIASVNNKFNDDVNVSIQNFKLDDLSRIIEKDSSLVKGNLDGNVLLKRVNNSYGIIANASIQNLIVHDVPIGNLVLRADNPTTEKFDIDLKLTGTDNNLSINGYYIPKGGDNSINIKANVQSLSMKTVEAFSMGQISEASGMVSGNFKVGGKSSAPDLTGELTFNDVFMNPSYINNRIELKHETIQLKSDGIYFKTFTMLDAKKNAAIIDGVVHMKQFSDFDFALHASTKDFLLFNTTAKDNEEFYGRMIIDSKIDIKGPMSLPVINARLKMKKGSNFTFVVPEDELTTDKGEDVVEFEDTLKSNSILNRGNKGGIQKSGFKGFDLSSIIEVDKAATLRLLMDPASSDSLVVRGEAALSFTMDKSGKMSLTGAYNLNEGSYVISLQEVIKKKFDIIPGSTITWNGDPLDANISINATYAVRAAPYDLMFDQIQSLTDQEKGSYKQLYPFLVLLKLRGAILKPEISFEIQLLPEDKGILGGAVNQKLNLLNEDPSALNKQVFALLILSRFVQENPLMTESGGASTLIRSTVSTFLSTELNKLSSKFVPGVEMNFDIQSYDDYQTGTAQGRTQVGIGLKKQLFNERLSVQVGGSVDVEGQAAKQNSASDITGDVTVEYKLTKDGRYRLKAFRHNQYEGAIDGQLVETGAGVVYVRDFNKWKEFFLKPEKKKNP